MRTSLTQNINIDAATDAALEEAWTRIRDQIDLAGYTATITVQSSPDQFTLRGASTGYGTVRVRGGGGYPGQVVRGGFYICDDARVSVENMTIDPSNLDLDGIALSEGDVTVSDIWIGGAGQAAMHAVGNRSKIRATGPITVLHGSAYRIVWCAENSANIELPCPLIISGGPSWDVYAQADGVAVIDFTGATITKAAERGRSAAAYDCSLIRVNGMPASWLPGDGTLIKTDYGVINADRSYT